MRKSWKITKYRFWLQKGFKIQNPHHFWKKNCQKVAFWSYLNKHIFGLEFNIFCWHLKIHMLMSWKPTSNNSYRPFNNSRLTVYLNPQRGIWKWLTKMIAHFVMFLFKFLVVDFLVSSILLSNSKWWMVYKKLIKTKIKINLFSWWLGSQPNFEIFTPNLFI